MVAEFFQCLADLEERQEHQCGIAMFLSCAAGAPVYKAAMPSPQIDIHHIAKLSRLALTAEEAVHYQEQLTRILGHIDQLSSHTLDAEPSAHAMPVFDVVRADVARPGFTQEEALSNAPRRAMDQFQIPKVIE
jgi:aspartyl-tRNA(Asn)/glutamyl-tRNA(Gln) amidotransferase subunit C